MQHIQREVSRSSHAHEAQSIHQAGRCAMKPRSAGHLERSSTIARDARDLAPLVRAVPVPKRAALNSPHGGGKTQLYGWQP